MHALLFNIIFQGLAVWALCCLVKTVLDFFSLKPNPLQKLLTRISAPVLKVIAVLTPKIIPESLHIVLGVIWLLTARVAFYLVAGAYGFLP